MTSPDQPVPGCFGAASVYSMDSAVCQACSGFVPCGGQAIEHLQALRRLVDVSALLEHHAAARQRYAERLKPPAPASRPTGQPALAPKPVERKRAEVAVPFSVPEQDRRVLATLGESSAKFKGQAIVLYKRINGIRAMLSKSGNPFAAPAEKNPTRATTAAFPIRLSGDRSVFY